MKWTQITVKRGSRVVGTMTLRPRKPRKPLQSIPTNELSANQLALESDLRDLANSNINEVLRELRGIFQSDAEIPEAVYVAGLVKIYAAARILQAAPDRWRTFIMDENWRHTNRRPREKPEHQNKANLYAFKFVAGLGDGGSPAGTQKIMRLLKEYWAEDTPPLAVAGALSGKIPKSRNRGENTRNALLRVTSNRYSELFKERPDPFTVMALVTFAEAKAGKREAFFHFAAVVEKPARPKGKLL